MADVAVELDEGARVEQLDEPLARKQLALLALTLDRLLGTGVPRLVTQLLEPVELGLGRVGTVATAANVPPPPNGCRPDPLAGGLK